jgi:glycosyltransferase involved in cell wall biosynthesis
MAGKVEMILFRQNGYVSEAIVMDEPAIIPVSAVIPTANRTTILERTLLSLFNQSRQPSQIIIVDASQDESTAGMVSSLPPTHASRVIYRKALQKGAAAQRMTGIEVAEESTIFFLDDDLLFEPGCIERMWKGFDFAPNVGAVNAMITNQKYTPPGMLTRIMYRLMSGERQHSFAGRVIGPAWNLLPEDRDDLPEYVPCDWLNTTCTMYRRSALPDPVFLPFFTGYSMMEDLSLSLIIARNYVLLNARTARIFHDSQPGDHKRSIVDLSAMELTNRHFVMTTVLGRRGVMDYLRLFTFEMFSLLSTLRTTQTLRLFPAIFIGKLKALVSRRS